MKFVPTPPNGYPHMRVRVSLSGATYDIRWLWNERDGAWTFSMWDPSGDPLIMGVRVALNVDLLGTIGPSDRRPPYGIFVVDPKESGIEPTRTDFGTRVKVVYADPEEAP
jgi:hypothetical protein